MAVKSKEEILESVKTRIGEQTDDETLSFLEDITDTFNDLENRANNDNENWKNKYEENDKQWREKYKERFFNKEPKDNDEPEGDSDTEKPTKFEDLFIVKEN